MKRKNQDTSSHRRKNKDEYADILVKKKKTKRITGRTIITFT